MSSSVSFRITRTAEDLAQAITALSQRLIKLEERQEALELRLRQQQRDSNRIPDQELATLDGIDELLRETRELLQTTETCAEQKEPSLELVPAALHQHQPALGEADQSSSEQDESAAGDGGDRVDQLRSDQERSGEDHGVDEKQPFAEEYLFAEEQPWQDGHHLEHQDDVGMAA